MGLFDKNQAQQAAPAPNTSAISDAQKAAADTAAQHTQQQFDWAKNADVKNTATADDAVSNALDTSHQLDNYADTDRQQYENSAFPALQQEKNDAATYASSAKKDLDVGAAQAGVAQSFDAARQNSERALQGYGVNPSSGASQALDIGTRTAQAAAQAAAGTNASNNVDAVARQLNHQVLVDSAPLATQSNSEHTAGVAAGTGAVNAATANTASGAATAGTGAQWAGIGNAANAGAAGTMNATAGVANDATKINNEAAKQNNATSSGIGSAIGTAAGLFLAKGGAVDPGDATPGGAVPVGASPTAGQAVDDVKANLTAGEYIVPKDVVSWLGQQHFQKLIDSSRQKAAQATAKPTLGPAVGGPTAVHSRPQAAIPMGHAA